MTATRYRDQHDAAVAAYRDGATHVVRHNGGEIGDGGTYCRYTRTGEPRWITREQYERYCQAGAADIVQAGRVGGKGAARLGYEIRITPPRESDEWAWTGSDAGWVECDE